MRKRRRDPRAAQQFFLKCPHCKAVQKYSMAESQRLFIMCKRCLKEFRAAECSPLTGGEAGITAEDTSQNRSPIVADSASVSPQRSTSAPGSSDQATSMTPRSSTPKRSRPKRPPKQEQELSPESQRPQQEPQSDEAGPPKRGIFRRIFRF